MIVLAMTAAMTVAMTVVVPRSVAQREMLAELRRREAAGTKPEWFAPNMAVVRALARKGFVTARLIGQRWWTIRLTEAGRMPKLEEAQ